MFITALIQVHIYNSTMLKKGLYFRDRVHMDLFDFVGLFPPKICNTLCPHYFFRTVRLLIYLIEIQCSPLWDRAQAHCPCPQHSGLSAPGLSWALQGWYFIPRLTLFKVDSSMFCIELSEISTCVEIGNRCHFDIIIPRESEVVLKVALKKAKCAISTKQQHLQSASGHSWPCWWTKNSGWLHVWGSPWGRGRQRRSLSP